jgi:hypothetical protein
MEEANWRGSGAEDKAEKRGETMQMPEAAVPKVCTPYGETPCNYLSVVTGLKNSDRMEVVALVLHTALTNEE